MHNNRWNALIYTYTAAQNYDSIESVREASMARNNLHALLNHYGYSSLEEAKSHLNLFDG